MCVCVWSNAPRELFACYSVSDTVMSGSLGGAPRCKRVRFLDDVIPMEPPPVERVHFGGEDGMLLQRALRPSAETP